MNIKQIKKRDGRLVNFDITKIEHAIQKAFEEQNQTADYAKLANDAVSTITSTNPTVEEIQDAVEKTLMTENYPNVAKAYILYRNERTRIRDAKSHIVETLRDITNLDAKDSDMMRENANIDADTAMGTMLKYGSESAKEYYKMEVLDPKFARAHAEGDIHIHDLDFYTLTTTCCQIELKKLFKDGFSTGHGYLREPNSIMSYASLAAIAIQANQNDQHGGQSICDFDYAMADGVKKSFKKAFAKNLAKGFNVLYGESFMSDEDAKEITEEINPSYGDTNNLDAYVEKTWEEGNTKMRHACQFDNDYENVPYFAQTEACRDVKRETYQAMEAFIHNLNTMHSRAGAQTPFSSINYGMDTSPEGRLVIKQLLLATEAGLGNGETPIFPVQIFKVKEGVNYNEGDPNYDLFRLAMHCSAKRLFPNFSFLDAPFNAQYYKGTPETEIAYMGCVEGNETIAIQYENQSGTHEEIIPFEKLWNAYSNNEPNISVNHTQYIENPYKLKVWDSNANTYVKVKTLIKNPNKDNWFDIKFSNGRHLLATADHPLPIENKGRTYVHDIIKGDKVKAGHIPVKHDISSDWCEDNLKTKAWLDAMMMCDGCYQSNIVISTGPSEQSINNHIKDCIKQLQSNLSYMESSYTVNIHEQNRHKKGHYFDIFLKTPKLKECKQKYIKLFNGVNKKDRLIPEYIFDNQQRSVMCAFLGGIIDADGGISNKGYIQIGSTSKALAYQQFYLADKLGYNPKIYLNHYDKNDSSKIRYRVEFASNEEIANYIFADHKREKCLKHFPQSNNSDILTVISITKSDYNGPSYDMETESDRLDISGIQSHNCRTRVMGNEFDKTREITPGRGNLSFTSINLPRLGIEAHGDIDKFFEMLQDKLELVVGQLDERFNIQSHRKVKNMPFLMGQGVWIDSENLKPNDEVGEVLKHGSLSVGFIGLAECLVALIGKHHGESEEAQKLGLEIVGFMRKYLDKLSEQRHLNYGLIGTPAEGLSGRFVAIDKKKYGEIKGVTDREYYTNSFHIPVYFNIPACNKIELEAPYHTLTNAGHISYVELDGDLTANLGAFETIIRCMKESGVGYGSINHPVDRCPECGHNGVIYDECPNCGCKEVERIRRITGYLVGTLDRFNDAKRAEEHDRVKHGVPLPQK